MRSPLTLQELGIVVAMQQPNPSLVTEEFLKLSGVIPNNWQLARQPINNERGSQLLFTNGVSIVVELNRIMFGEMIGDKEIDSLSIATVAQNYLNIFKLAKYQAIGINIRSYSPQSSRIAATQYINHQLLADGSWQNFGTAPIQAALNVIYTLERRQLTLSVNAAEIQFAEQEFTPIILFSGNFSYDLATSNSGANLTTIGQVLANWQQDIDVYCELINEKFLVNSQPEFTVVAPAKIIGDDDDLAGLEIAYAPELKPLVSIS